MLKFLNFMVINKKTASLILFSHDNCLGSEKTVSLLRRESDLDVHSRKIESVEYYKRSPRPLRFTGP
jgi:hypothetical protein